MTVMMEPLSGLVSMSLQTRFLVDASVYYGLVAIVALSLGFMYRKADIPFLRSSVPFMAGWCTVSALSARLAFTATEAAGVELLPYASESGWVCNNEQNVALANEFLESRPLLCLGFITFTLAASFIFGAALG